jgi:hypothetical protein
MKRSMLLTLGLAFGAASLAHAQATTAYGPDNGFFRPSRDVSLTAPRAAGSSPQAAQQPFLTITSPQVVPVPVAPAAVTVAAPAAVSGGLANPAMNAATTMNAAGNPPVAQPGSAAMSSTSAPVGLPPQAAAQAWTERQMDRSENEADRARVQMQAATPGVGAAFDGTTSPENR